MTFAPQPKKRPWLLTKRDRAIEAARQLRQARAFVRKRDKGRCVACGKPGSEVHHVTMRSLGGKDDPDNLALLCSSCHTETHGHVLRIWRTKRGWKHERIA
jgi:5-methylcytosine-specific restriction endonuclease McrA